ncbi:hypothetical protein ACQ5TV_05395 [Acetobacter ghanensis]|uniref:hypothetical protein n=1 Tax=Acetobacter ghanensis TaxID=431306 RepID=UPI003D32B054
MLEKKKIGFLCLIGIFAAGIYLDHEVKKSFPTPAQPSQTDQSEAANIPQAQDIAAALKAPTPFQSTTDSKTREPIFDGNFTEMRRAYDQALQDDAPKDGAPIKAGIASCSQKKKEYFCQFKDEAFQSTVLAFKKLDILNGKFVYNSNVNFKLSSSGKVSEVIINGDRSDPANLLSFGGNVLDFISIWDGSVKQPDGLKKYTDTLGLMRGDNSPDIGQDRIDIEPFAEISCIAWPSSVSMKVSCRFVPRS